MQLAFQLLDLHLRKLSFGELELRFGLPLRCFQLLLGLTDLRFGKEIDISLNRVAELEVAASHRNDCSVLRHLLHTPRRHAEDRGQLCRADFSFGIDLDSRFSHIANSFHAFSDGAQRNSTAAPVLHGRGPYPDVTI